MLLLLLKQKRFSVLYLQFKGHSSYCYDFIIVNQALMARFQLMEVSNYKVLNLM